jgi:hypothetical protein
MILLMEAALPAPGHVAVVTSTCSTLNARLGAGFVAKLGLRRGVSERVFPKCGISERTASAQKGVIWAT